MLTICGVSNPHNGLSDELLHLLSFMLCFVPKQNKLWKLGVPESCADLHIYWNFQSKKLYFWQENTCMQSILYYTCFGGNPLKMPAKWQVYIKEETKLFLESMYLWGVQTFWGRHYAWFFVLKCLLTCLIELLQLCSPCGTYDGMASSKSHPHRPKHDYRLKTQTFT